MRRTGLRVFAMLNCSSAKPVRESLFTFMFSQRLTERRLTSHEVVSEKTS
jgi:hypothetical protein